MSPRKPSLGAIFLTVLLDLLGFGLVLPFLAEEARDVLGATAFEGTLLASVYSLMQFLFVPVWGRLSDRIGRRPVILWSVAATAIGMMSLGLSLGFGIGLWALFATRIFTGIATANLGTASAYIADVTKPEDRARGMGMIGMAFGIGFILGPGLGGALASIKLHGHEGAIPCFVAAGLSVINFVWAYFGLAESLPEERRAKTKRSLAPLNIEAAKAAFSKPGAARAILVNFLIVLAFTNLDQTFRYFNKDIFGMTALQTGGVLAFVGVVAAGVQGGAIRPLAKKFGEAKLIRIGTFLQGSAFVGIAVSATVGAWMLYVATSLLAFGNGLTQPSTSAYVSKCAGTTEQGSVLGTNQAMASLARMFGPASGGFLYGAIGARSPYIAASIGMAIALVVALGLKEQPQTRSTSTQMS